MKNLYTILCFLIVTLTFGACKSDQEKDASNQEVSATEDMENFIDFDLRPYEINASIKVPQEERTLIRHELDSFEWDLKKGKQTYITIHDWGTMDGFKKYLEDLDNHSEKVDIIEQEDSFILYKLTTGTSKVTFHTAAQYEVEGINYIFESSQNGLSEDGVKDAVFSVKNVSFKD